MFGRRESAMSEKQREAWAKTRERGEAVYCVQRALVLGGIAFFVHGYDDLFVRHFSMEKLLRDSVEPVLIGAVIGFISGIFEWHSAENRYSFSKLHQDPITGISHDESDPSQRGKLNGNIY